MTVEILVIWLIIGAVAGWLAGFIVKGYGFGLIGNIVVGIVGAFVGGWLFSYFGIAIGAGLVPAIVAATSGAVVILVLLGLVHRAA
jgi:uncharacterized membrane protein YeaQ/YmgE (transglycosylase-associated protein family)